MAKAPSRSWQTIVADFEQELGGKKLFWQVQDLCRFLKSTPAFKSSDDVVLYLFDYLAVSECHLTFHRRWPQLPNMRNVSAHDKNEIVLVRKLLKSLLRLDHSHGRRKDI